jgi:hypothetical protein
VPVYRRSIPLFDVLGSRVGPPDVLDGGGNGRLNGAPPFFKYSIRLFTARFLAHRGVKQRNFAEMLLIYSGTTFNSITATQDYATYRSESATAYPIPGPILPYSDPRRFELHPHLPANYSTTFQYRRPNSLPRSIHLTPLHG